VALWITGTPFFRSLPASASWPYLASQSKRASSIYLIVKRASPRRHGLATLFDKARSAVASDHDDHAGGGVGLLPVALATRFRHGFTTAVLALFIGPAACSRDFDQHFSNAGVYALWPVPEDRPGSVMKEAGSR